MAIGEIIRINDIDTYSKLMKIGKEQHYKQKNKAIELGDKPERLMRHDTYKRVGGRIRQIK